MATEIELRTFRSETVGVKLAAVAGETLLISCSTSSLTFPLTLMRGETRRIAIVDRVDDRVVRRQHRSAAGGDWHDIADLKGRRLIVDHNQGWVGQHLDAGDGVQRVQDGARLRLRSDQEIESGECAIDEGVGDRSGGRRDRRRRRLGVEEGALIWP